MANNRIIYATQQVGIAPTGTTTYTAAHVLHGMQSIGMNTRFNLEQVFELGMLAIYENIENLPDVEITLEKVLDGYPLIYHMATVGAPAATLVGRANVRSQVALSVFQDTADSASGAQVSECEASGTFVSALNYNFPVDGRCTESVTLVCNNKLWRYGAGATYRFSGKFNGTDIVMPDAPFPAPSGHVQSRWHVLFGAGAGTCTLPQEIDGIDASGKNVKDVNGNFGAHVQSIRISVNLGRENMNELGRKGPYHRYVNFPVEVRCDIEVISTRGDLTSVTEEGVYPDGSNTLDRTIFVIVEDGTQIDLGSKNRLSGVTYGGGNAGNRGGNVTCTYSYVTYNDMTVQHPQDPTTGLRP
jgi:hypothetical protein